MEGIFDSEGVTKSDRTLHTPGNFAKSNLLYVQEVGKLQSLVPHVCKRNDLDSYLIFEVMEGKGSVVYEGKKVELHKGDCIWIDCHQAFEHISSKDEPWQLAWVHFNGRGAKELYEVFREKSDSFVFETSEAVGTQNRISEIHESIKNNLPEIKVHGILTQLLVDCTLLKDEKNLVKEIRKYINLNYKVKGLVENLAERFGGSKQEIEKLFEQNYGISLRDYILNRKFNAAKEMLRFTVKSVETVIDESRIENEDLFYRLFVEKEGMSPEEYREKWAQWIKD